MIDEEIYSFALKTALTEMKNLCPDVTHSFIFSCDGEIVAGDDTTDNKTMTRVVNSFNGLWDKADSIGGIDSITLQANKGRVQVSHLNKKLYMLLVTSKKADMTYINMVSRVLIPTIVKILEKLNPTSLKSSFAPKIEVNETLPEPEPEETQPSAKIDLTPEKEPEEEEAPSKKQTPTKLPEGLVEIPTHQLIVDTLGGLLVRGDTVQIDQEILDEWAQLWDGKIAKINIETFDGETVQCKVKPITDSKLEGKGLIRIPEKLRRKLNVERGELIRVSPVLENEEEGE